MIEEILELITKQFATIMQNDTATFANYKVYIANEQQFVKTTNREKGAIYIVVKFLAASINFGQTTLPITINAVAEQNKIEICQKLLLEFAQTYNLTTNDDETIKQTYTTPAVVSNFNEVLEGFRSLFSMAGTYLISENANPGKIYVHGEESEIDCITFATAYGVQLDTQVFYNSNNQTKSVGKIGTFVVNITTYLTDNEFLNRVLDIVSESSTESVNSSFYFDIVFKNRKTLSNVEMKLTNFTVQQNIGELPVCSLTFTR